MASDRAPPDAESIQYCDLAIILTDGALAAPVDSLRRHRTVIWSKPGVMARSDSAVKHAVDLIEFAETAAC